MKHTGFGRLVEAQSLTPPPAALPMPAQDFRANVEFPERPTPERATRLARWTAFGGGALLTAYGAWEMAGVVSVAGATTLEWVFVALFTIAFGWIALSAMTALAGLLFAPPAPRTQSASTPDAAPDAMQGLARTAIVMPVYNERPDAPFARLHVMAEDILRTLEAEARSEAGSRDGAAPGAIEIFILSDTRDPQIALEEILLAQSLRQAFAGRIPVWYRRRRLNKARKSGNVHEFVEAWGARYDFMLVLDADSLMRGDTIVEMIRRMQEEPRLALLQTSPQLVGARTLFGRLQQFASALYGPVAARAVAAWQGEDGNFWGHNALIRVRAFAAAAGLPLLPGRMPFGGVIMSHDFVEAALLRRAGWDVRMDADLSGSWEEGPPTLTDSCVRDRRWAQGNLQHLGILNARGFAAASRAHLALGAAAFLMSPVWLLLLLCGVLLSLQAGLTQVEYFADGFQLFPSWPRFDSERMLALLWASVAVLLAPKAIGLLAALADRGRRRAHGGALRLIASAALELVASTLLAPLFMIAHTRHVFEIFSGRDSGWSAQARDADGFTFADALRFHRIEVIVGLAGTAIAAQVSTALLLWLSPVLVALILAPALSWLSAQERVAGWLRRRGLLLTDAESRTPAIVADLRARRVGYARLAETTDLGDFVEEMRRRTQRAPGLSGDAAPLPDDADAALAAAKLARARDGAEALRWLTASETSALLLDGGLGGKSGGGLGRSTP